MSCGSYELVSLDCASWGVAGEVGSLVMNTNCGSYWGALLSVTDCGPQ